nr:hypothetical protein [Tanacetum cinerariifolium]
MHNNIMAAGSRDRPYNPTTVVIQVVPSTQYSLAVPEHITVETILNMSLENKAHFESEKEAIHLLLTGIGDEIYSTADACKTAHEIWEAIESCNDASQCSISSTTSTRMVKEVNELRAERIAKTTNPLALVATAQPHQDYYYQAPKSHKPYAPTSKSSLLTRSHATTRHKGKEIAKPITPPFESASEKDSDPEQAQKPKRVKDSVYYKEKMLLCKQAKKGVPLQAEQFDWLEDMDEKIDEQELKAHYSYMAKI